MPSPVQTRSPRAIALLAGALTGLLGGLALPPGPARAVTFADAALGLSGFQAGCTAWGDYDADGDLDLLIAGTTATGAATRLYRNSGGATPVLTDIGAGFPPVTNACAAWADCDNDGDLDFVLAGLSGSSPVTLIFVNSGGSNPTFSWSSAGLPGVRQGAVAWGDIDRDGDADLLLTGRDAASSPVTALFRNMGGVNPAFQNWPTGAPGVFDSAVAIADFDRDGDLDLVITGQGSSGRVGTVLTSDGANPPSFTSGGAGLAAVTQSAVACGDYDGDGDPDLLVAGQSSSGAITRIYRNTSSSTIAFVDAGAGLPGVSSPVGAWGDCDNDGDLDLLLAGTGSGALARIYRNNGGASPSFTDIAAGLTGVTAAAGAWGDYDGDRDLDVILAGAATDGSLLTRVYRSSGAPPNLPPAPPSGLTSVSAGGTARTFSWQAATDDHTPLPALTYNVRLGSTPGASDRLSALASASTGLRHVPAWGNAGSSLSMTLDPGIATPIYWSVQAIDAGTAGSAFATEQQVPGFAASAAGLPPLTQGSLAWGDFDADGDMDLAATGISGSGPQFWLLRNAGGTPPSFVPIPSGGLAPVSEGSLEWADYDNDGDLDLLVTGMSPSGRVSRIYRNGGGSPPVFTNAPVTLPGLSQGGGRWGDYDGDGWLDIVLTGGDGTPAQRSYVYRNGGGANPTFVDSGLLLPGGAGCRADWGDYDNDGALDLVLVGRDACTIYRNSGGATPDLLDAGMALPGVTNATCEWGDFNGDGYLDLLVSGERGGSPTSLVYRNGGGPTPTLSSINASLTGVRLGVATWADYDNDGDLDVLLAGMTGSLTTYYTALFRNAGGSSGPFTEESLGLLPARYPAAAWADVDSDGDLDFVLSGDFATTSAGTTLYSCGGVPVNAPPTAPGGLTLGVLNGVITLSWMTSLDDHTPPAGLNYAVRLGTAPGTGDLLSVPAEPSTGYRRVPARGPHQTRLSRSVALPGGGMYYASVQAIDSGRAGSHFSPEVSVNCADFAAIPASVTATGECGAIRLRWGRVPAAFGYRLRRDGTILNPGTPLPDTTYLDPLGDGNAHCYAVSPVGCGPTLWTADACGAAMLSSPLITVQPVEATASLSGHASFTVAATGAPDLTYRWARNGVTLADGSGYAGATTPTLSIDNVSSVHFGSYTATVASACNSVTSNPTSLSLCTSPVIDRQPSWETDWLGGQTRTLAMVAHGPALQYQWYKNGAPLTDGGRVSGSTTANLTISDAHLVDFGDYTCKIFNACAAVYSDHFNVAVYCGQPVITFQPGDLDLNVGNPATFFVEAQSCTPWLSYAWQKDYGPTLTTTPPGARDYQIPHATHDDVGHYHVTVNDGFTTTVSRWARLGVTGPEISSISAAGGVFDTGCTDPVVSWGTYDPCHVAIASGPDRNHLTNVSSFSVAARSGKVSIPAAPGGTTYYRARLHDDLGNEDSTAVYSVATRSTPYLTMSAQVAPQFVDLTGPETGIAVTVKVSNAGCAGYHGRCTISNALLNFNLPSFGAYHDNRSYEVGPDFPPGSTVPLDHTFVYARSDLEGGTGGTAQFQLDLEFYSVDLDRWVTVKLAQRVQLPE